MEALNPTIRLMQAVRYADGCGLTKRDIVDSVLATFDESGADAKCEECGNARGYVHMFADGEVSPICDPCWSAMSAER